MKCRSKDGDEAVRIVIHIEQEVRSLGSTVADEQGSIRLGLHNTERQNIRCKCVVPCTECLFQTIQGLVEPTNKIWMSKVFESRWLGTVDCLDEHAMEKGILDIKLMDRPSARDCKRHHSTNCGRLDNGTESLTKINRKAFRVTTNPPV
jgi:hypothetical protein